MKREFGVAIGGAAALMLSLELAAHSYAADRPLSPPAPENPGASSSNTFPTVPSAALGAFTAQKKGANGFHLIVTGHRFTSRRDIELYMAYRASEIAQDQKASWFTFVEARARGDTVPSAKRNPSGLHYSFRMEYFRPVWRFKAAGAKTWTRWSPFTGAAFPESELKSAVIYEVSADIVLHRGLMDDADPLAFEAGAVNDFLVNQVSPPQ